MSKNSVRPLLFRPGAQYTCHGDGLCCTDIHGLGPITKKELVQIRKIDPKGAGWDDAFEDRMLTPAADGGCHFLMADLRCSVHAEHGPEAKPEGCRRFPLGLVATPKGGRVTTQHRCPCRTMGKRPDLTEEDVLPSLLDGRGRPHADNRVTKVKLEKKKKVSFDEWLTIETDLLKELASGAAPEDVLDAKPFPRLKKSSWEEQYEELLDDTKDGSAFGVATAWFAETMRGLLDSEYRPRVPWIRPWAPSFDRAEQRDGSARTENAVFADWIADEIWSLKFAENGGFAVMRADLRTRLAIGRAIAQRLIADHGLQSGRAAAEAVMVVELIGESDFWTEIHGRIRV